MRVVVLQHESIEGPGVWTETLLEHGARVECVLVPKRGIPESAEGADLVISMGGSMSVNDPLPWIAAEIALLGKRIRSGGLLLGVCLGSQLIAKAAGGIVETGGTFEIGFDSVELTSAGLADAVTAALPPRFGVLQWHGEVFRDVPGAVTLARSMRYPIEAFRVARAYGLLFHLEATLHSVVEMSRAFPEDLRRGGVEAGGLLEPARQRLPEIHEHARQLLGALLRLA
ncbi:MAG TPA: type 1 glutamine amidotransferase [Candidatus Binatia bacterium]|nr:type 1 glutamine amidotransferase [Candidatus Binatia bacterium]